MTSSEPPVKIKKYNDNEKAKPTLKKSHHIKSQVSTKKTKSRGSGLPKKTKLVSKPSSEPPPNGPGFPPYYPYPPPHPYPYPYPYPPQYPPPPSGPQYPYPTQYPPPPSSQQPPPPPSPSPPYPVAPPHQYYYPYPYPAPYPPSYPPQYYTKPPIYKKMKELPLFLIFLVILTVFWLPYIISNLIAAPFLFISESFAEVIIGVMLCIITILLMIFLRQYLDRPTWKEYGLSTQNLGSNLFLAIKLVFIIFAIELLVIYFFDYIGVNFEGGVEEVDIFFIISAVIIAPIFEETVYRMNASTLLARRLPIIWVAGVTSFWFIAKHIPMWHFDNGYGLGAVFIIVAVDVPLWIIVTYYFLKRQCIWIPVIVHVFNNGSIVLFHYLPSDSGMILEYVFLGIGILFIFIFGLPGIYRFFNERIKSGKLRITSKTYRNFGIATGFALSLLITSEALVFLASFETSEPTGEIVPVGLIICSLIGFLLIILGIVTIIYVYINKNIIYVKG